MKIHKIDSENCKVFVVVDSKGSNNISIGGTRFRIYGNDQEAIDDAKRLARNMTLKYKTVGLGYGGLKAVITSLHDRAKGFAELGRWLEENKGQYYLATDVGTTQQDMLVMKQETDYVLDLPAGDGIGDLTPLLTKGVMKGLEAAMELSGVSEFCNSTAYVHGLGKAGFGIVKELLQNGVRVYGHDINFEKNSAAKDLGVKVTTDMNVDYDMIIPCSWGDVINPEKTSAGIIGGAANNPVTDRSAKRLHERGIIYVPDYIISAGAIVIDDLLIQGEGSIEEGSKRVEMIKKISKETINLSRKKDISTVEAGLEVLGVEIERTDLYR